MFTRKMKMLHPKSPEDWIRLASIGAFIFSIVSIVVKFFAWHWSGSISMLSLLIDAVLDMAMSSVTLFAIHHALQPPDHEHRFGHGKAESLASLFQVFIILISATCLAYASFNRFVAPQLGENISASVGLILISLVGTCALVQFQTIVIQKTNSPAIVADRLHYQSDVLLNVAALINLILSHFIHIPILDSLFGIAISIWIAFSARKILLDALHFLLDRELMDSDRSHIAHMILSHPQVKGMHELRTRSSGRHIFIQVHIDLDANLTLRQSHAIAEEVESAITLVYLGAQVIVHQDPLEPGETPKQDH
jgi:ferrous-iron efflux pump FieF